MTDLSSSTDVLGKFLAFIESTPIILDYVTDCGECEWDMDAEVTEVRSSYGRKIFSTGETEEEEVRNVFLAFTNFDMTCSHNS